jgi:hypothetical protein
MENEGSLLYLQQQASGQNFLKIHLNINLTVRIVTTPRAGRPGFDFRHGLRFLSLRWRVKTGSGALPAYYQMDIGDISQG